MAQINIPILLLGTAYLISNDKEEQDEGFTNWDYKNFEKKNLMYNGQYYSDISYNLKKKERENLRDSNQLIKGNYNSSFNPNMAKSVNNMNNELDVSQYQDKFFIKDIKNQNNKDNVFKSLNGNQITYDSFNHNNMNVFYGSKTTGGINKDYNNILDNYTGQGTYDVKKEEVASFFKPEDNLQNVHGNQNQNDFFQSRVNDSKRHANTKPWQEIKDTPGIGLDYGNNTNLGYNNFNEQRNFET